jgi:hypothetical protein
MYAFFRRIIKMKIKDRNNSCNGIGYLKSFSIVVLCFLLFLSFASIGFAKKIAEFPSILRPLMIDVQGKRVFIAEKASISIFSLPDFKLVKTFGRVGEAPKEFMLNGPGGRIKPAIQPDKIFVMSSGKVSYFTLDGEFIDEIRVNPNLILIKPFGEKFIAYSFSPGKDRNMYETVTLLDKQFKATSILCQSGPVDFLNLNIYSKNIEFASSGDKIFLTVAHDFKIEIFDRSGKKINMIERKYEKREFTGKDKQTVIDRFKSQNIWGNMKTNVRFPGNFPTINHILVDKNKLYIFTYKVQDGKSEVFIYTLDGKLLNRVFLPIAKENESMFYPFTVRDDTFYQLIENDDTETLELHSYLLK